jgi:subtilisin family serine protease
MRFQINRAVQPQWASSTQHFAARGSANPLSLVNLTPLMDRTCGSPNVTIGLIDGPVLLQHPDLASGQVREVPGLEGGCTTASSSACQHGTFVAGILSANRNAPAPAICPGCTLLVRPIFAEVAPGHGQPPSATPQALAAAIIDCVEAGARVINLSLVLAQPSGKEEEPLAHALDQAVRRGVIIVAAAGNQGTLGSSALTRHPWVIPVVAFDLAGRPMNESNLGGSIGRHGLGAPGDGITSLGAEGKPLTLGGTSAAAPFVTGAIALLWSEFPSATGAQMKLGITQGVSPLRPSVTPPLLNAAAAHQALSAAIGRG